MEKNARGFYEYSDSTSQGFVVRSSESFRRWRSEWDDTLMCMSFVEDNGGGDRDDDLLPYIRKEKPCNDRGEMLRYTRAYNRHRKAVGIGLGIICPPLPPQTNRFIYRPHWTSDIRVVDGRRGAKSLIMAGVEKANRTAPFIEWTPEKDALVKEYNEMLKTFNGRRQELSEKIFGKAS